MDGPPLDPGGDSSPPSSSPFSPCRGDRKAVGGLRSPPLVGGSCSPPDVPLQGGSLSHDMEVLIKQEVDGLDVGGLQSPHVTGDEGDDGASSDLLGSVDSTTVLPFLSSGDGSPQPNAPLVPHQYQGGDLHDFHPHHLPQHHQHLQHHQHHHQQHQQQLVQREFTNNIPGFIHMTNQEQAIRTSAMLYEDIIAGYGECGDMAGYGECDDMAGYGECGDIIAGYGECRDMAGYGECGDMAGYGECGDMAGYGECDDMAGY
ncbi:hypothetical protein HAZT_HAZT007693, partial [Hyalella azteca]